MVAFSSTHPLGDVTSQNHESDGANNVTLCVRDHLAMVQVFARNGKVTNVATKLGIGHEPGLAHETGAFSALPIAPGQWMLVSKEDADTDFGETIAGKLKGIGYVSEQSDSRVCIRVSGANARDVMTRGCRLDLHPKTVTKGFCAQTPIAQVGVLLHLVDDAPVYDLYIYSGFARSFWDWLTHTAGQFGYAVDVKSR